MDRFVLNVPDVDVLLINHADLFVVVGGEGRVDIVHRCDVMVGKPMNQLHFGFLGDWVDVQLLVEANLLLVLEDELGVVRFREGDHDLGVSV